MQQVMKYGNFIEASLHGSSAQLTESYKKKLDRVVEYIKTLAT